MGKKGLRGIKKLKAFTSFHGGVVGLGLGCSALSLRGIDSWLGHEHFWLVPEWKKGFGRIEK